MALVCHAPRALARPGLQRVRQGLSYKPAAAIGCAARRNPALRFVPCVKQCRSGGKWRNSAKNACQIQHSGPSRGRENPPFIPMSLSCHCRFMRCFTAFARGSSGGHPARGRRTAKTPFRTPGWRKGAFAAAFAGNAIPRSTDRATQLPRFRIAPKPEHLAKVAFDRYRPGLATKGGPPRARVAKR